MNANRFFIYPNAFCAESFNMNFKLLKAAC